MRNKLIAGAGLAACLGAWASDPVIMTVNGVDVPKSEFEYLYHKNSQQQLAPQPLEDYVEMFKIYKLKVADAKAEGLDTTAAFRREMAQYRADLSAPYLADSVYLNKLVKLTYDRSQEEAEARHIMRSKGRTGAENRAARQTLDSIRNLIVQGADFSELARQYSHDRTAKSNGGYLGYITVGHFPYDFETVAFSLAEGEVSEIVESPMAYHILLGGKHRKARGTVQASHIMKMVQPGASPEVEARAKAQIDSLYDIVSANPDRFAGIATADSDDKGSARNGGQLPWFGAGEMVPAFDSVAFALPVGGISKPVRSQYGWHIIHKTGERPVPALEQIKPSVLERIANPQDDRNRLVKANTAERLAKKHKGRINAATLQTLKDRIGENGIDSAYYDACRREPLASLDIYVIDKKPVAVTKLVDYMRGFAQPDHDMAEEMLTRAVDNLFYGGLVDAERDWLEANQPEYRNLLNEYRDGSLLYEASVRKVWDKASKDQAGLDRYFAIHRQDYAWPKPHVKGVLVQAVNDSVAEEVRRRLDQVSPDSLTITVRKEFAGKAQAERVLLPQGGNAMVDHLMFGGPEAKPSSDSYTTYFIYDGRVLDAPEEAADVRGMVTSDYQNELEAVWVEELKSKYPVKVNEKVLKKVK